MNVIDLFAGCGGFSLGFKQENFRILGCADWESRCIETLKINSNRKDSMFFLEEDLRLSFEPSGKNSTEIIKSLSSTKVDGIIGGPPCQAYSLAGRVQDENNMENDYRNYLFENYVKWLKEIKPTFFVLENVTGMLSAAPGGTPVIQLISEAINEAGFVIPQIGKNLVFNLYDLGGTQNRKRVILFGVNKNKLFNHVDIIEKFYSAMKRQSEDINKNVRDAIGDLEILKPLEKGKGRQSHEQSPADPLHRCRFHNGRDIEIFQMLAKDKQSDSPKFSSSEALKTLYFEKVGKTSNVHKYNVIEWDKPSNLIPAHLHKDGLRHIHPDPDQARTITMREAARLQDFPDSYIFNGSQSDIFKMIGNAVSPLMARKIAQAVKMAFN